MDTTVIATVAGLAIAALVLLAIRDARPPTTRGATAIPTRRPIPDPPGPACDATTLE